MKKATAALIIGLLAFIFSGRQAVCSENGGLSRKSRSCLMCHKNVFPNIHANWSKSRMASVTPAQAAEKPEKKQRVSFDKIPEGLSDVVVGCAECHTIRPDKHEDTFNHQGFRVHTVVTPDDCAACHPKERSQYSENIMSEAVGNLENNPVYSDLVKSANGVLEFGNMKFSQAEPDDMTNASSCFFCHGTRLSVEGFEARSTNFGEMEFPVISGWPNQGVGRLNPDGSKGSCAACHSRHQFSIEMARKPYTCAECHKGPDVPAYKVYKVSKHSQIADSLAESENWDFEAVPWTVGKDFGAPTCAACHVSMIETQAGEVRAERTHRMNDRLGYRIFGLIYAHAHPKSPDTSIIKNKNGLSLPTALDGTPASEYLISGEEQEKRTGRMKSVCLSCHSRGWVEGHFARLDHAVQSTNRQTEAATRVMLKAWEENAASQEGSLFDEAIERRWVEQWLFYGNSTRFAAAMLGADYGVFDNGRWMQAGNPHEMLEMLKLKLKAGSR